MLKQNPDCSINESAILFEKVPIRRMWLKKEEKWYFSIVDVVKILTDSTNPTDYLKKIRKRDTELGSYIGTYCPQVEMFAETGKKRKVLAGNIEHLFRIIQSVPSPKAEPIKRWLAKVGYERLQETTDPELAVNRARRNWKMLGRPDKWIEQRMRGQEVRNQLTNYWGKNGIDKKLEYAKLTDIIHKEWSDLTVQEHKNLKNLKRENLRDNMTEAELIFTSLAELSTTHIAKKDRAEGYSKNAVSAKKGGGIAKRARKDYELQTGQKVISKNNFLPSRENNKKLKG